MVRTDARGTLTEVRCVAFAVGEIPFEVPGVAQQLIGEPPTPERLAQAGDLAKAALDPPSDLHASAAYRRHLMGVLVPRALSAAVRRDALSVGKPQGG